MATITETIATSGTTQRDLTGDLQNARKKYADRNPQSHAAFMATIPYMPGANTRTVLHAEPFPLTFSGGKEATLTSIDGDDYIDFLGEYSAGIYGHSCEAIKTAIQQALDRGWNLGGKNEGEVLLSQMVVKRFNNSLEMVRFCNSGTEANLMAIGAAVNFTGKPNILAFVNGYHGSAISFPATESAYSMNAPFSFVLARYNDILSVDAVIAGLPENSLAAIITEPMQGAGGCIAGHPSFLHHLQRVAGQQNALLILDEVMTSRLAYGGFQVELGLKPDITTLGKWIGGGMSFGAFGGRRDVMEMFDPRMAQLVHSGTFNNNVFTMAAGIAGCTLFDEAAVCRLNAKGDSLRCRINETIDKYLPSSNGYTPAIVAVGIGSLCNISFAGSHRDSLQALFYHHLLGHGIYIATRGYIALSLEITNQHIAYLVTAVEKFVVKYQNALRL